MSHVHRDFALHQPAHLTLPSWVHVQLCEGLHPCDFTTRTSSCVLHCSGGDTGLPHHHLEPPVVLLTVTPILPPASPHPLPHSGIACFPNMVQPWGRTGSTPGCWSALGLLPCGCAHPLLPPPLPPLLCVLEGVGVWYSTSATSWDAYVFHESAQVRVLAPFPVLASC